MDYLDSVQPLKRKAENLFSVFGVLMGMVAVFIILLQGDVAYAACSHSTNGDFTQNLAEARRIRQESIPVKNELELFNRLQEVFGCLEQFTDSKFRPTVVSALLGLEKEIPPHYLAGTMPPSKNPHKLDIDKLFPINLASALGKACSTSKNEACIPILWDIVDKQGIVSVPASRAIAAYGEPKEATNLIERIRTNKAGYIDVAAFGHEAASRIAAQLADKSIPAPEQAPSRLLWKIEKRNLWLST
jgi:hypothetical protein